MSNERTFHTKRGAPPAQLYAVSAFYENIVKEGVDVDRIELLENGDVDLEYTLTETDGLSMTEANEKVGSEMGLIAGSYAPSQTYGDLGALNVLANADDGQGSWFVDSEWAGNLDRGAWSENQLIERVLSTLTEVN